MAEVLELMDLDEYVNAQEYETAIRAGISMVWGRNWDNDPELAERVLPARLIETKDGLHWLAENVLEQTRLFNDVVGLLEMDESTALDKIFGPIPEEGEARSLIYTNARLELSKLNIRTLFFLQCFDLYDIVEAHRIPIETMTELLFDMIAVEEKMLTSSDLKEGEAMPRPGIGSILQFWQDELEFVHGQSYEGAFWRRFEGPEPEDDMMSENEEEYLMEDVGEE